MSNLTSAVVIIALFYFGSVLVAKFLDKTATHFDSDASELFRLISNSQRAILIFIGAVLALDKLGFDVSALVAGLGLTGFAMGFALKDAISNLVAGMMIVLYKTINLGDIISISGSEGEVIDINLRHITIRFDNTEHIIPNSLLLNQKVSIIERNG